MIGALLLRGMLVGVFAGFLGFAFLKIVGEPAVDHAIAFETQLDEAKAQAEIKAAIAKGLPAPQQEAEPELVSRKVQAGIGLFTGVVMYSAAFGGLFALAFALAHGRAGDLAPRATCAVLAVLGFAAVYVVPVLKYPANPPSVGDPSTIGMRTALYFSMIALSLAGIIAAGMLRSRLAPRYGVWNAALIAGAAYLVAMLFAGLALPAVDEVPAEFPAVVLWQFRIASMGAQLILWTTLGLAFGAAAERVATGWSTAGGRVTARRGTDEARRAP
jgi:hypothetical protein